NSGASQFQRCITTWPPIKLKITMPRIAAGAIQISLFNLLLMFCSSRHRTCRGLRSVHLSVISAHASAFADSLRLTSRTFTAEAHREFKSGATHKLVVNALQSFPQIKHRV